MSLCFILMNGSFQGDKVGIFICIFLQIYSKKNTLFTSSQFRVNNILLSNNKNIKMDAGGDQIRDVSSHSHIQNITMSSVLFKNVKTGIETFNSI